jgi:hypothetical protein
MMDVELISAAIAAATSAVGLIDKIGDQIERFVNKRSVSTLPPEHREKIERDGNAIVQKVHGIEVQRITAADLQKLPEADLRHIKVLEKAMENHYAVWAAVYPQLALEVDPIARTKIELRLKGIIAEMKDILVAILDFLRQAGLELGDHYRHIRSVVAGA